MGALFELHDVSTDMYPDDLTPVPGASGINQTKMDVRVIILVLAAVMSR